MRTFTLFLQSPASCEEVPGVVSLRFEAPDGARGVQPGHEPALALLESGVARLRNGDDATTYLATDGGLVWIDRGDVRIVSRWIARAPSMEALVRLVQRRRQVRGRLEEHARRQAQRHEVATRRALAKLQREVGW